MKRLPLLTMAVACLALGGSALAQDGEDASMPEVEKDDARMGTVFYVKDPVNRNVVTFESQAPLEDIVGTTAQIEGYVVFDPSHPDKGVRGKFRVPVSGLDTGIPLRNEHLQNAMWLNAKEHPYIQMDITGASGIESVKSSDDFSTWQMQVEGTFTVNGRSRPIAVSATVTYLKESEKTRARMEGNLLAGRAEFEVALADYDIKGMKGVVGSKVSETIEVMVSFTASDEKPEMASN